MDDMLDIQEVEFEIYIEDKLTNKQMMKAPKEILMVNFVNTAKQIQRDQRPIMIKMIRPSKYPAVSNTLMLEL